jgi:hypothetical protein
MAIVRRDPALPHQIVIFTTSGKHLIAISCNCMRRPGTAAYEPIEARESWPSVEDELAAYRNARHRGEPFQAGSKIA